ncbi:MAG: DNA repair protein RecN [Chlamydiia bacterium]|nr:DNA repair protein RecN [Chlamydiia bacterium]MCH9615551.1 DNA repair protein RecN [Chlamydiia bacterium]MCH9629206.1 DNA repair protein RecN [Chlamydiia bacterium]
MLIDLRLKNIVLIDETSVTFGDSLNILSGETGAGKTILIQAIAYLLGQKADPAIIREGSDKGIIEGVFDVPSLAPLLDEMGIDADEHLIIKREIAANGKSRAFINGQSAPLSSIQKLGPNLFEMVGQHATTTLRSVENQLAILDHFGQTSIETCQAINKHKSELQTALKSLQNTDNNLEFYQWQLNELTELSLTDGEEQAIETKLGEMHQKQERFEKLSTLLDLLSSDMPATLSTYATECNRFNLSDCAENLTQASICLNETSYTLSRTLNETAFDTKTYEQLEDRLLKIHRLQKKYGHDLVKASNELQTKINALENLTETIEEKEEELKKAEAHHQKALQTLKLEREKAGEKLSKLVTEQLASLNMKGAEFRVIDGEFFLRANVGEKLVPIKERTSGGELSRLLFVIKVLLKESTPTLVLDELDANIGGETASLFGEKLRDLGKHRQILCITHFPQVAKHGKHHLCASKSTVNGRTIAQIKRLTDNERTAEIRRMLG